MNFRKSIEVGGLTHINNGYPLYLILVGGIFLGAAGIECFEDDCNGDGEVLAVATGATILALTLLFLGLVYNNKLTGILQLLFSIILLGLWVFVAGFTTFEAPFAFPNIGNGFVAAWMGVICSLGNIGCQDYVHDKMGLRMVDRGVSVLFVIAGSLLVLVATVVEINSDCCDEQELLGLVAACVSILVCMVRLVMGPGVEGKCNTYTAIFLAVWWLLTGGFLTFGIFENFDNGYMGVLICVLTSLYMLHQSNKISPLC